MIIGRTYRIHFFRNETGEYDFLGKCVSLSPPTFSNVNHRSVHGRTITNGPLIFTKDLFTFHESGETMLQRQILNGIIPGLGDEYLSPIERCSYS